MTTPTATTFTTSLITPAPRLVQRDNALLGYYIFSTNSSTTTQELTCDSGEIFTSSSVFGGCYGTDYIASHTTLLYGCTTLATASGTQVGGVLTCVTPSNKCITQTIYSSYPNLGAMTNYFCAPYFPATVIYRAVPSTTSSSSSSSSRFSSSSSSSSRSSSASTSSTATSASISTTTPSSSSSSAPSKAWIAGPVLGSIAVIAFLFSAIFFYLAYRKRKTAKSDPHRPDQADFSQHTAYNSVPQDGTAGGYYGGKAELATPETWSAIRMGELGENNAHSGARNELPG